MHVRDAAMPTCACHRRCRKRCICYDAKENCHTHSNNASSATTSRSNTTPVSHNTNDTHCDNINVTPTVTISQHFLNRVSIFNLTECSEKPNYSNSTLTCLTPQCHGDCNASLVEHLSLDCLLPLPNAAHEELLVAVRQLLGQFLTVPRGSPLRSRWATRVSFTKPPKPHFLRHIRYMAAPSEPQADIKTQYAADPLNICHTLFLCLWGQWSKIHARLATTGMLRLCTCGSITQPLEGAEPLGPESCIFKRYSLFCFFSSSLSSMKRFKA
jgi:hypothetical protein